MDAHELREAFLRFFEERGHRRVPSAPIVPAGDPTLLFTSAGMVQFKPYFMGQARSPHTRLASVQKCFRTSDIESVGDTSHLTFFEMLGNFSIGDYFKAEIIPWAWEFVTEVLHLQKDRLWTAVYLDDDEAYSEWRKAGMPPERIVRYGEEDNYWFSGDVGPCGPCSEIYYDFGEQFGCEECEPNHECGRFLEIWNLVFMSFYCDGDGRTPLPANNIDTGSGLERVSAALLYETPGWDKDRLPSVYDTDLFAPLIREIGRLAGARAGESPEVDRAIRIVAEHCRALTFLIGDERTPVVPSNTKQGYVARLMLRRAMYYTLHLIHLSASLPRDFSKDVVSIPEFLAKLDRFERGREARRTSFKEGDSFLLPFVTTVIDSFSEGYPELERQRGFITDNVRSEEVRFYRTLVTGEQLLRQLLAFREGASGILEQARNPARELDIFVEAVFQSMPRHKLIDEFVLPEVRLALQQGRRVERQISGIEAFTLHDTYGFPLELIREIAQSWQPPFAVDEAGFEAEIERQRERARAAGGFRVLSPTIWQTPADFESTFLGYEFTESLGKVVAVRNLVIARQVPAVEMGAETEIILDRTPFYPEGGGQVGDRGEIRGPSGVMRVEDTQRVAERLIVHRGRVTEGRIAKGDEVTARVDPQHRADTMRNHTATHLLHAALRKVLGTHVRQAGSLVGPDYLRFDFTHTEAVTPEQLAEVSRLVNEKVRDDVPVSTRVTTFDEAMSEEGVLKFFGDKYGAEVRVVEVNSVVPRFSAELCGGTHCHSTGQVGAVVITGESSIGSGMRRIEAVTGRGADAYIRDQQNALAEIARKLGAPKDAIMARIDVLVAEQDALRRRIEKLERSLASAPATGRLMDNAVSIDGVRVLATEVDAPSMDALRYVSDSLRKELTSGVAVLAAKVEGRPQFVAIVSKDLMERGLHAGNLLKRVASAAGGGGGGRPDMAQGGGKDISKIGEALGMVPDAVREMLGGG